MEKSLGKKKIKAFQARYKTQYAPGILKAVAFERNGRKLSESELVSATGKTRIALKPEESVIKVGELLYINVEPVGDNGVMESNNEIERRPARANPRLSFFTQ